MASGPPLKLTIDRQNRKLVAFQGTPTSIPDLFQSNTISLQIQVVDPGTSSFPQVTSQQFVVANMAGFGMRVAVGEAPAGTAGQIPMALQDTMVWDATNQWFTGDLALNTTAVDTFLGTSPLKSAYFECNITPAGARVTILQSTFNLKAVVDELTGTAPAPANSYLTAAEITAQFAPQKGANGQTQLFKSPSGVYTMELGIDDNGQPFMKIIQ